MNQINIFKGLVRCCCFLYVLVISAPDKIVNHWQQPVWTWAMIQRGSVTFSRFFGVNVSADSSASLSTLIKTRPVEIGARIKNPISTFSWEKFQQSLFWRINWLVLNIWRTINREGHIHAKHDRVIRPQLSWRNRVHRITSESLIHCYDTHKFIFQKDLGGDELAWARLGQVYKFCSQ